MNSVWTKKSQTAFFLDYLFLCLIWDVSKILQIPVIIQDVFDFMYFVTMCLSHFFTLFAEPVCIF